MRKGVEDFLILLAIAIILLVAVSLLSGSFTAAPGPVTAYHEFSPGVVGFTTDFPSQTIVLGDFVVGEVQEERLGGAEQMVVTQSSFGGSPQKIRIPINPAFLELKRGVKLRFSVLEAQALGNLVVKWNGIAVYNARPSGLTTFTVEPGAVKQENILEFSAEGPGLQFWAATSYTLRNVAVLLQYGPQRLVPFEFLSSDLQRFDRGEVEFFGSGEGILEVRVNGFPQFTGTPVGAYKISFNGSYLQPGNNVVSFRSSSTNRMAGAVLRLYQFGNQQVVSRRFDLTQEQAASMGYGRGRVVLDITAIRTPGILNVRANGAPLVVPDLKVGENHIPFPSPRAGENELTLAGDGTWDIELVRIGVA
ncbi:MAG: hypothetical protein HY520_01075 [Candidatus Aenigmarchaeota archaeon]|nr:hypothetical protein [Candidatus Aenigmarchaeota archaeon]